MKIATRNVNLLKVRLPQVLQWLEMEQPDLLGLQETKLTDGNLRFLNLYVPNGQAVGSRKYACKLDWLAKARDLHILASPALVQTCTGCRVDKEPRGWERPPDHTPVVAEFSG